MLLETHTIVEFYSLKEQKRLGQRIVTLFDVTEKRTSISAGEKDKPDQEPTPLLNHLCKPRQIKNPPNK